MDSLRPVSPGCNRSRAVASEGARASSPAIRGGQDGRAPFCCGFWRPSWKRGSAGVFARDVSRPGWPRPFLLRFLAAQLETRERGRLRPRCAAARMAALRERRSAGVPPAMCRGQDGRAPFCCGFWRLSRKRRSVDVFARDVPRPGWPRSFLLRFLAAQLETRERGRLRPRYAAARMAAFLFVAVLIRLGAAAFYFPAAPSFWSQASNRSARECFAAAGGGETARTFFR